MIMSLRGLSQGCWKSKRTSADNETRTGDTVAGDTLDVTPKLRRDLEADRECDAT